jgi:hypothetical protein
MWPALVAPHRYWSFRPWRSHWTTRTIPNGDYCVLQNDALLKVIDRVEMGDHAGHVAARAGAAAAGFATRR